jgi:N-acetyl-anhydromuramyl-L-alanine amidase AmpD
MVDLCSPNRGGVLFNPTIIVCSNTASQSFATARARFMNRKSSASTHFLIGRDGQIESILPTDCVAWHAGRSEWNGRTGANSFSIALALVNVGPVMADGTAVSTGELLPDYDILEAPHRLPTCAFDRWQRYPEEQILAAKRLIQHLRRQLPTLAEVVDLSMIAAFRAAHDCGPALPLAQLQSSLEEIAAKECRASDSISWM